MQHKIKQVRVVLGGLTIAFLLAGAHLSLAQGPPGDMGGPPGGMGGPPPDDMQQQSSSDLSAERELKQLTKLLSLTGDQRAQVKTILIDRQQKISDLRNQLRNARQRSNSSSGTATAGSEEQSGAEAFTKMRAATNSIRKDASARIAALLNDAQKTKYAEWQEKREKRAQQDDDMPPPPFGGGGPPPDGGGPPGGGGPPM